MGFIDGVAAVAVCALVAITILSLIQSGKLKPSPGKAIRKVIRLISPRDRELPEGIEELLAPTVRDEIEAMMSQKFDSCKQYGNDCSACPKSDNDPEIVSRCGYDRLILKTLVEKSSREQELWKDVNLQIRNLLVALQWAKQELMPVLEETQAAFGKQAWRNRWFITSVLSNIGTIGTVIWWAVTTIFGGG
jgi:hypothetical protein